MTAGDAMGLPPEHAVDGAPTGELIAPLATLIPLPHRPEIVPALWMGGTHSALGGAVAPEEITDAIVIDCAGELPEAYRQAAGAYLPCVFTDIEARPARWPELRALVRDVAERVRAIEAAEPIDRVYVFCNAGMNRSGLVTALLLRALGEDADDAIAQIRAQRPGALSNETFVALVRAWPEV